MGLGIPSPDHSLTPGEAFPTATVAQICVSGYSSSVRDVSAANREAVFAEYGLSYPQPSGAYEGDHLIPLELGGDNSIKSLWPEPDGGALPAYRAKIDLRTSCTAAVNHCRSRHSDAQCSHWPR